MASLKESHPSRPLSQHRPSMSTTPSLNVPNRHSNSRNHAHSVSLGTFNPYHRVTRRKSMSSNANNTATMAAAVQGIDEATFEGLNVSDRRALTGRSGNGSKSEQAGSRGRPFTGQANSATNYKSTVGNIVFHGSAVDGDSAIVDGPILGESTEPFAKARARRASEGQYLTKTEGKRANGELRCEKCGKGYKHSSCLTKHLWEHTPEWSYTSKLLISKHQQVQLLEAASVLVTMNKDVPISPSQSHFVDSDRSSASPAASGSSELQDDDSSSAETTPPPISERTPFTGTTDMHGDKRYSNGFMFSRSYQSVPSASIAASSVPTTASYGSFHNTNYQRRPSIPTSELNGISGSEDAADLAAAVELCHFGTPRTGPVQIDDIPPVPPLPARYASHNANRSSGGNGFSGYNQAFGIPPPLTHRLSDERDTKVREGRRTSRTIVDEEEYDVYRRSDEDDDGVFGRMEE